MTYHCEIHKLPEVIDFIKQNIPEHYEEACKLYDYPPIDIDFDYYLQASAMNACFVVTVNKGEEPIGYSIFTLMNDPIRKDVLEATNVCLYVKRAFRGRATKKLMEKSKDFLKALGAEKTNYIIKNKSISRLLEKMGGKQDYELWSVA